MDVLRVTIYTVQNRNNSAAEMHHNAHCTTANT